MTTHSHVRRGAVVLGTALISILLLAACTPPAGEPTPTPIVDGVEPTPTPTPATIDPLAGPEPVIGIECDGILSTSSLASAFPSGVSPIDAGQSYMGSIPTLSLSYTVRSLGGLACEWNNGAPGQISPGGSNPAYAGVIVLVLPNATTQWARYESIYSSSGGVGSYCSPSSVPSYCSTNQIVGTSWVEVTVVGGASDATGTALGTEALSSIAAAGPGAAPWSPPSGTLALPAECSGVVSDAAVQSALGISEPVVASVGGGGWSLQAGARENWGGPHCYWSFVGADAGVGSLSTIRGGAWAWNEVSSTLTFPSTPASAAIAGLAPGDEAWLRCAAADEYCVIDLIIGGNWVEVHIWRDAGPSVDKRAGALAVGAAIVATLTP